jgi:GTP-binding protein
MKLPIVAIVGRPNVGKSSLLNRLVGRRISIVDPTPGVTRDRISVPCPIGDGYVELVDTGGIGIVDHDDLTEHVENQISYGLAEANLLIFLVDAREGATPLDRHVAERLRRLSVPVILAANKIDEAGMSAEMGELNSLGFGEPIPVSAHHGTGIDVLAGAIERVLGELPASPPEAALMKLAIVGKRNAGKSTFINALAGQERVIVSETPGTTRDSVDVTVEIGGRKFMLIDTAGVRKKRRIVQQDIEFYSYHRALRSIRRADVVALMIDASMPVSKVDKDLSRDIIDEFKPLVLVVNKWDLAQGRAGSEDYDAYFDKVFPELTYAPICLTSATTGMNIHETIGMAEKLFDQSRLRVPTARLNEVIRQITAYRGPSHKSGTKPPKILYALQITTCPPTIICFVNDVRSFDRGYQRFLVNQLRLHLPYAEIPIRVLIRSRREHEGVRGQGGHTAEAAEAAAAAEAIEAAKAIEAADMELSGLDGDEHAGLEIQAGETPFEETPVVPEVPDERPSHAGGDRKRRVPSRAARYAEAHGQAHGKPHGQAAQGGKPRGKAAQGGKPGGGKARPLVARPKGKGGSPKPGGHTGGPKGGGPKGRGSKGPGPKGGGPKGRGSKGPGPKGGGPKGGGPKGGGPRGQKGPRGPRKGRP